MIRPIGISLYKYITVFNLTQLFYAKKRLSVHFLYARTQKNGVEFCLPFFSFKQRAQNTVDRAGRQAYSRLKNEILPAAVIR